MKKMVEMKSISKAFSGISVLKNVELSVSPGEVVALMGENGAGKSTLMKILCGVYESDSGVVFIEGEEVKINNPRKASELGIRVVHQEFSLIDQLTVAENMFLGQEPAHLGFINYKQLFEQARQLLGKNSFELDARAKVGNLSIAHKQLVEIAKATMGQAKILILDEPTSALSGNEVQRLFQIIRSFKDKGVSIIYISHKLEEVIQIADRVVVLKDGQNSGESPISEVTEEKIVRMMVGRQIEYIYDRQLKEEAEVVLRVEGLGNDVVDGISFDLHAGEILGVAGLMGSGRTELLETIFGKRRFSRGTILLDGRPINNSSPSESIQNGFAFATEDRKGTGLVLSWSVKYNISLPSLRNFVRFGLIDESKRTDKCGESVAELNIKMSGINENIKNLSGGNQQKVVLSKWINTKPRILLVDEPTRGIDVGAKAEIYELLKHLTAQGVSVIMVSSELPQILALSDRILVMNKGRATGLIRRSEATEESIMFLATKGAAYSEVNAG